MKTDVSNWLSLAENPKAILSLYGKPPSLSAIDLIEVKLHRDGPRLELRADLAQFPEDPPDKWRANGYNTVQMKLSLVGLKDINISSWSLRNLAKMKLEKRGGRIALTVHGDECHLESVGDFLIIDSVRGYVNDEPVTL